MAGGEPFWPAELRYLVAAVKQDRIVLTLAGKRLEFDLRRPGAREKAVDG